jgi:hypothetical protein
MTYLVVFLHSPLLQADAYPDQQMLASQEQRNRHKQPCRCINQHRVKQTRENGLFRKSALSDFADFLSIAQTAVDSDGIITW